MSRRLKIKTTIEQAVNYWSEIVDECDLTVDWAEAGTHCWRCGCERNLQRCHIVPDSLGGEDVPQNIVLLCARCHAEGPNVIDPNIMWDWIKAYKVSYYNTFWENMGQKEYAFIYKKSVKQEIDNIIKKAKIKDFSEIKEKFNFYVKQFFGKASTHFGQAYYNNATIAGLYRMFLKKLASEYDVALD